MISVAGGLLAEPEGVDALPVSEAVRLIFEEPEPLTTDTLRHEYEPDKLPLELNGQEKPLGKLLSAAGW
jgi:hypothetical protein